MAWEIFWILLGSLIRNVQGWFENASEDGFFSKYEWGMLGATVLRVVLMGFALHYGFDQGAVESTSISVLIDYLLGKIKSAFVNASE